ncbi:hypothetical protein [Pseudoalteromonas sp.]|uniref:hypothetical protein n=1 Tax=Pseudoalteromonas sp. TaxID=53249 RepID=UPI002353874A|nr:hypothetical protein [Pseudoalteromonas sp.]
MASEHSKLLLKAYEEYLNHRDHCSNESPYLSYDFKFLNNKKWSLMAEKIVSNELRELTNLLNRWKSLLSKWRSWNLVLSNKDEMNAWHIRSEFVESIVNQCLFYPSSMRDNFSSIATSSFHQIKLSLDRSYKDSLDEDSLKGGFLMRSKKEKQLKRLVSVFPESEIFLNLLKKLNNSQYVKDTLDYRNLASHSIAPNLVLGETNFVTRTIEQATKMSLIGDNLCGPVGKTSVVYGFGGTPPINLEEAIKLNYEQYQIARECYTVYLRILMATVSTIENVAQSGSRRSLTSSPHTTHHAGPQWAVHLP